MRMRSLLASAAVAATTLAVVAGPAAADHTKGKKYLDLELTTANAAAAADGFGVAPEGTSGTADMYINAGQERFCLFSEYDLPDGVEVFLLHLHEKAPSSDNPQTGPVVIDVTPRLNDAGDASSGCVTVDSALLRDVLRSPSDYYINAHVTGDDVEGAPVVRGNFDHNGDA